MRKHSQKRDMILAKLRSVDNHPTAEWLYAQLKPECPDLSLATVYRNLALFVASGDAVVVGTVGGQARYDGSVEPHAHFVCETCGQVIDVPGLVSERLKTEVEKQAGVRVTGCGLTFRGTCACCG